MTTDQRIRSIGAIFLSLSPPLSLLPLALSLSVFALCSLPRSHLQRSLPQDLRLQGFPSHVSIDKGKEAEAEIESRMMAKTVPCLLAKSTLSLIAPTSSLSPSLHVDDPSLASSIDAANVGLYRLAILCPWKELVDLLSLFLFIAFPTCYRDDGTKFSVQTSSPLLLLLGIELSRLLSLLCFPHISLRGEEAMSRIKLRNSADIEGGDEKEQEEEEEEGMGRTRSDIREKEKAGERSKGSR